MDSDKLKVFHSFSEDMDNQIYTRDGESRAIWGSWMLKKEEGKETGREEKIGGSRKFYGLWDLFKFFLKRLCLTVARNSPESTDSSGSLASAS